jgi:glycosyltransferase involved in cell wall biosynthesis
MTKYTAVVPTMLKTKRFFPLVDDLLNSEYIDEVIVIDNSGNLEPSIKPHSKLNYICEGKNTGCNPAWNKGVKLAKNECVVICNDDINFDPIILNVITEDVLKNGGIIGMGEGNFDENFNYDGNPYLEEWRPGVNDMGWGCLIFTRKSDWIHIPDDLIVWYGDNFIKDINPVKKSILRGYKVETEMSSTTDLPELSELKKQDGKNWLIHFQNRQNWRK